jgi:hypothetical protein
MTTRQTLEAARAKIADEYNWTQGDWRRGEAYCALGAIEDAGGDGGRAKKALKRVLPWYSGLSVRGMFLGPFVAEPRIWSYNDTHSHECVLAAFDRAIEREKEKES